VLHRVYYVTRIIITEILQKIGSVIIRVHAIINKFVRFARYFDTIGYKNWQWSGTSEQSIDGTRLVIMSSVKMLSIRVADWQVILVGLLINGKKTEKKCN